ncbi:MAG TPA: translation initiation factor IF-3 [Terriglobales bacterium]|nr:translation initiation factor IF-3 [Terriglobales bacterium]
MGARGRAAPRAILARIYDTYAAEETPIRDFRPRRIPEPRTRINERIRAREVRVIDEVGTQLGILTPQEAITLARQRTLDLVEVAPNAEPPVCRIMDFGKYQYQMEKKAREARKNQKNIVIKEVKFRPSTDEHDYEFKKNNVIRFLGEGDKVKATVQFRGREITHKEIGFQLINKLLQEVEAAAIVEFRPRMEGNALTAILAPKKSSEAKKA